jgi:uncharacterized protein YndB with AHSA1/START domain
MDNLNLLAATVDINATLQKTWDCFTLPEHITKWYFASDDWCAPKATNDLQIDGKFNIRMESKDGSIGFDFCGRYIKVEHNKFLEIILDDNRYMCVLFEQTESGIKVTELFEPETENPKEMQQAGWQMILNNFKTYAESF